MAETSAPEISIVIPAYNIAGFIAEALSSLRAAGGPTREIIVIDDGSTDETAAVAEAAGAPGLRVIRTANGGVSAARNRGLGEARGACVLFLDGDDLLAHTALTRLHAALMEHSDAPAAFGAHVKFQADNAVTDWAALPSVDVPGRCRLEDLLVRNIPVTPGTVLCRTAAVRSIGGFDPGLRMGEDWEFFCRLAHQGDLVGVAGGPVLFYRQRMGGAAHRHRGSPLRQDNAAIETIFSAPGLAQRVPPAALRRAKRQALAEQYWAAARQELWHRRFARFAVFCAVGIFRHPASLTRTARIAAFLRSLVWRPRPGRV